MSDLSEIIDFEPLDVVSTHAVNHEPESVHNGSINGSLNSFGSASGLNDETMRILFLVIASTTILICLTICISVCICMCLNRYVIYKVEFVNIITAKHYFLDVVVQNIKKSKIIFFYLKNRSKFQPKKHL